MAVTPPALKDHLANELAWALETTRTPPHIDRTMSSRGRIEREYARLHRCLHDLDNALHGWLHDPAKGRPKVDILALLDDED